VDVLVTMAVVVVLISLLSPSLSSVRETAHQVVCRSNTRQLGLGINQYADAHDDAIPKSVVAGMPWETMTLLLGENQGPNSNQWDGLGRLHRAEFIQAPKVYYCPSHRGGYPFKEQESLWANEKGPIVGNFQYRGQGVMTGTPSNVPNPLMTSYLSKIKPRTALVSDGLRTQSDFNHVVGANFLRADLSVGWYPEGGRIFDLLAKDGELPTSSTIAQAWRHLDELPE
jgi:hypothetical protein